MSAYSIWLDLEKESRVSYRKIISTLSKRLKSPLFEPHCTIYGRLDIKLSDLKNIVSKIVNNSNQFSSSVKKLSTGKSYYKSLYVKLENNTSLKNSWKDFNFQKCQEKPQRQILEEIKKESDQIERIFKDSLNFG